MRIQVRLPKIQPDAFELPKQCPYGDCSNDTFKPHGRQGEAKAVRDTDHTSDQPALPLCSLWPPLPRLSDYADKIL